MVTFTYSFESSTESHTIDAKDIKSICKAIEEKIFGKEKPTCTFTIISSSPIIIRRVFKDLFQECKVGAPKVKTTKIKKRRWKENGGRIKRRRWVSPKNSN